MRDDSFSNRNWNDDSSARKQVFGTTGMPGAGKSAILDIMLELGLPAVVMGDEVRAEAKRQNLDPTRENLGRIMLQIRTEEGSGVLARRCIPKVKASESPTVVIDGLRSLHEVDEFRGEFTDFKIIAVHASPETRFKRLIERRRSDDPKDWETFLKRDQQELSVGIGEVIATADYMVINESSMPALKRAIRRLIRKLTGNGRSN